MKINLDSPGDDVRIEIIPLIDVIFCILTFFILASLQLTRQQAISVALPQATTGTPQMRDMLIVSLDDLGQVYVEQQQIPTKDQLRQAVKNYNTANPTGLMVLYAAKNASYNDVVQILDLLREVGGTQVALATLPSADQKPGVNNQSPASGTSPLTPYSGNAPLDDTDPYLQPNSVPTYTPYQPQLPANSGQQLPGQSGLYPVLPNRQTQQPNVPNSSKTTTSGQKANTQKR